jgi:hypothetical protein
VTVIEFVRRQTLPAKGTAYPVEVLRQVYQHRTHERIGRTRFAAELGFAGVELVEARPPHGILALDCTLV